MRTTQKTNLAILWCVTLFFITWTAVAADSSQVYAQIVALQGEVYVQPVGASDWVQIQKPTELKPGWSVRAGKNSRARVLLRDNSVISLSAQTTINFNTREGKTWTRIVNGIMSFFHRDKAGEMGVEGPQVAAVIYGTEFVFEVSPGGACRLALLDGEVTTSDNQKLTSGDVATAAPNSPLRKTSMIERTSLDAIQWCLYYPGLLDLAELDLPTEVGNEVSASIAHYRAGDLPHALAAYPAGRVPAAMEERVFYAALLLSIGGITEAESLLNEVSGEKNIRMATALKQLIASVQLRPNPPLINSNSTLYASEWMALSYHDQSRGELLRAREDARQAVKRSPQFGFAWARLAELEFGFGRTSAAREALEKAFAWAPNNAQAQTLRGFILSAENRITEARKAFEKAIAMDAMLGNAWLGRGLCRIRGGDVSGGRADLEIAAAAEPQRALLRSYLAKAFIEEKQIAKAQRELDLAKLRDPLDPTSWLYSALLKQAANQFNEAVRDLEKSKSLNNNRSLFRSRYLLDQDQAVRSANLAALYREAGMPEVGLREAVQAVNRDYANHSAHLFMAESYDALRDPTRFNLRYETVWFNERLLANLLAPVGAGSLSQHVSMMEYSQMFERNRLGLSSYSDYRGDGQFHQLATQFGRVQNTSYALDLDYQFNDGNRMNNQLSRIEWYSTVKQQLTAQDSIMLQAKYQDYHSGDNFQYHNLSSVRSNFRYDEKQEPILFGGYHHEWSPGVHTLFLGGRLINDQSFYDQDAQQSVVTKVPVFGTTGVGNAGFDTQLRGQLEIYTSELSQILENERHTLVVGGRFQTGKFKTSSVLSNPSTAPALFNIPAADTNARESFLHGSGYAYYTLKLPGQLSLTGGAAYERLQYPENFRSPPISAGHEVRDQVSPKAALVWSPSSVLTLRGSYTRSLGGASLDESYRLEPTQLAGFVQSYRTLIPESLVGSVAAPRHETLGVAMDLHLKTRTYLGLQYEDLSSRVSQTLGVFDYYNFTAPIYPSSTRQRLDYRERSVTATFNQLLADEWSVGADYRYARADLGTQFTEYPAFLPSGLLRMERADLHQLGLHLNFNHRCGFFARAGSQWYWQDNLRASSGLDNDSLCQVDLFAGYRFPRKKAEFTVGVMNLANQNYQLNPLNVYSDLPRQRVFVARLLFNF